MNARNEILFFLGVVIAAVWVILAGVGDHPDGALLGFAGTLMLVSSMHDQRQRKRERDPDGNGDDDEEDPTPHIADRH